jgi:hypothetical protein
MRTNFLFRMVLHNTLKMVSYLESFKIPQKGYWEKQLKINQNVNQFFLRKTITFIFPKTYVSIYSRIAVHGQP